MAKTAKVARREMAGVLPGCEITLALRPAERQIVAIVVDSGVQRESKAGVRASIRKKNVGRVEETGVGN
jgi:hypothetical protein